MISAKEARKEVEGCNTGFAKREQALAEKAINAAIQDGKCFVNIDQSLSYETRKWLRGFGYKVSQDKNQTHISW